MCRVLRVNLFISTTIAKNVLRQRHSPSHNRNGFRGKLVCQHLVPNLNIIITCLMSPRPDNGKVLRQLDIATSQTIAIEIISGVGKVADDSTPLSLWALGDQMLIRVWQQKVGMGVHVRILARFWSDYDVVATRTCAE